MTLDEVIQELELDIVAGPGFDAEPGREVTGAYASDLLSCVMASARSGDIWITLQAHPNIVAVASLIELAAVIITEGVSPGPETVSKAQEVGVMLLSTQKDTFTIAGQLAALGVQGQKSG